MRTLPALTLAALPWLMAQAESPSPAAPDLTWLDAQGRVSWSTPLEVDASGLPTTPLGIGPSQAALPPLDLELLEGEPARTTDYTGQVLVIDFWASWCGPCAETLPWLQSFHEQTGERGLRVLTVNMQESDDVARQFLWALNVKLPVARYTAAMQEALEVEALPTVLVVDRDGLIRARIDGYGPGVHERITRLVEELLEETAAGRKPIAEIVEGAGTLEALWSGPLPARLQGLTVVSGKDGPIVLATANQELFGFSAKGEAQLRKRAGPGAERLIAVEGAEEGPLVFGYRPVGTHVVRIPVGEGRPQRLDTASHVLDLSFEPAAGDLPPRLLLGTVDGLAWMDVDGQIYDRHSRPHPVWQVSTGGATLQLGEGGRLAWLDSGLKSTREIEVAPTARLLVAAAGTAGAGVAPAEIVAAEAGSFLAGPGVQVAAAVAGGLLLLDAADGRVLWRAAWPRIAALAKADLDGDGRSELLVGAGRRVVALGGGFDGAQPRDSAENAR